MSITTHGYLPVETENGVGFTRVALADMTPAEVAYVTETRSSNTLCNPGSEKNSQWSAAYEKLKAARAKL